MAVRRTFKLDLGPMVRRGKRWFRYGPDKRLFKQLQKTLKASN
jgi:hypothetical protein